MLTLKNRQKPTDIRSKLWKGFGLVILVCTILMAGSSLMIIWQLEIEGATRLLDTALKTAWAQYNSRPVQLQGILREASHSGTIQEALAEEDAKQLKATIRNWMDAYPFADSWVITDPSGRVICRSGGVSVGERWHLAHLVEVVGKTKDTLISTETISGAELVRNNPELAARAEIQLEPNGTDAAGEPQMKDGLITIVLAPVVGPDGETLGVLAGGILLNNDTWISSEYTKKVPRTYLSIGDAQGIRIVSNIETDVLKRPMGTLQEQELLSTTSQGKPYRGNIVVDSKTSLLAADPILNHAGEVVGNIGVGAPINMFGIFNRHNVGLIVLVSIIVLGIAALLSDRVGQLLVEPICRLKEMAHLVANNKVNPEELKWRDPRAPVEVGDLGDTFIAMAKALRQKEQEAQTYARDLFNEKAQLEVKIQERTRELAHTVAELRLTNNYKSQFLANMSHELRTPLNAVIGFSRLLEDQVSGDLNRKQQRYVYNILVSANHLLELINDILDLVKIEQGKESFSPDYVSVQETVDAIILLLGHQARDKNLTLCVEVEPKLPEPYWGKRQVKQILSNLVSNAVKFTPEGGEITIRAEKAGDSILFTVQDTGIGIDPEDQERVFLAFEQAESSYTRRFQGAGLGLAISKKLVELHEGEIWLESTPGQGTTVFVRLPIIPMESPQGRGDGSVHRT